METKLVGSTLTQGETTLTLPTEKWAIQIHSLVTKRSIDIAAVRTAMTRGEKVPSDIAVAKRMQHDADVANNATKVGALINPSVRFIAKQRVEQLRGLNAEIGQVWFVRVATASDAAELDRHISSMEGVLYDMFGVKPERGDNASSTSTDSSGSSEPAADANTAARFDDDDEAEG